MVRICARTRSPLKQAVQLGAGVVRQRRSLRYADGHEPVGRIAQAQAEAANAEAGENRLDAVDEPRLLTDQGLPFAVGRRASSSSSVGIAAILQWRFSARSQPRKARIKSSVSSPSVSARRCSRDTATLAGGWHRPQRRARSQREAVAGRLIGDGRSA